MNLAGAFRGLGVGLTQAGQYQLQQQAQDRRDAILMEREQALERLRGERSQQELVTKAKLDVGVYAANKATDTEAEQALLPAKTKAQIEVDQAKIDAQTRAEYDALPAKIKLQMTVEQYRQAQENARAQLHETAETGRATMSQDRQDARSAADRAEHVVATGVDGAGNLVVAKGNDSHVTFRGMKPEPKVDPFNLGMPMPGAPATSAPTTGAPQARPTLSVGPDTAFRTLYANASPDKYPGLFRNGQKISMQEAWSLYKGGQ